MNAVCLTGCSTPVSHTPSLSGMGPSCRLLLRLVCTARLYTQLSVSHLPVLVLFFP